MTVDFQIQGWAAYAPGLSRAEHWLAWASQGGVPALAGCTVPDLPEVPAIMRRRLDPLGRMAVQVAWWCEGREAAIPKVFASRYGDASRSLNMLRELVRGQPLSPTSFGLSVHNAIGALYSMVRGDRGPCTSVAAGPASAAAALVEAAGLLADGAAEVLVVCYDAPLPPDYARFEDEPSTPYAWAWRVRPPADDRPFIRLTASAATQPTAAALPFGLDVLRFSLSADEELERTVGFTRWSWRRCHA